MFRITRSATLAILLVSCTEKESVGGDPQFSALAGHKTTLTRDVLFWPMEPENRSIDAVVAGTIHDKDLSNDWRTDGWIKAGQPIRILEINRYLTVPVAAGSGPSARSITLTRASQCECATAGLPGVASPVHRGSLRVFRSSEARTSSSKNNKGDNKPKQGDRLTADLLRSVFGDSIPKRESERGHEGRGGLFSDVLPKMKLIDNLLQDAEANSHLLQHNQAKGDVAGKSRDIDFTFFADTREQIDLLGQFVTDNRYGSANLQQLRDDQGREAWRLVVVIHAPATESVVNSISALMVSLAVLFDVEYEGWGCVIQSPAAGPPPLPR